MFFDTVIRQAVFRRFHRSVSDAALDDIAQSCGCLPIGRMCLLDDTAIAELVDRCDVRNARGVIDLGCGRGFLGRWLREHDVSARYVGVDRIAGATEAARRHIESAEIVEGDFRTLRWSGEFDAAFAIEIAVDAAIDDAVFEAIASALGVGGRFAATIASLDGNHAKGLQATQTVATRWFSTIEFEDWTARITPFARHLYERWLTVPWPSEIVEKSHQEARTALEAIERGSFHYAVLIGTS